MNARLRAKPKPAKAAPVAVDFKRGRWSLKTQTDYEWAWRHFEKWCADDGCHSLPVATADLARYLAKLAQSRKVSGVSTVLSAIRAVHRLVGMPINMDDAAIADPWAELKRENGTANTPKAPLTWELLTKIVPKLDDDFYGKRAKAMLLTAFGDALRRSELCNLNVTDLTFTEAGVSILIRKSKTDQTGKGKPLKIPRLHDPAMCAVAALERWLEERETLGLPSEAVFVTKAGVRMIGRYYADMVKAAVELIGLDPTIYSGHSTRRGYVTTGFENGAPPESLRDKTRHASMDMLLKYRDAADVFDSPADVAIFGKKAIVTVAANSLKE